MNRVAPIPALILGLAAAPAFAGTFAFTADVSRCQLNSIVRGTCISSHSNEPLAAGVDLDCRILEGSSTVQLKLDRFTSIPDTTMYTVVLTHLNVLPQTWYCAQNDGEYYSIFGTSFAGQNQSSDCVWYAGSNTARP